MRIGCGAAVEFAPAWRMSACKVGPCGSAALHWWCVPCGGSGYLGCGDELCEDARIDIGYQPAWTTLCKSTLRNSVRSGQQCQPI